MKTTLEKFLAIRQSTQPVLRELLDHVTDAIEEINGNTDVKNFVAKRKLLLKSDQAVPDLPVYEQYSVG